MILLFAVALFILPLDAGFANSPIVHLSDALKLKCDALPYRTAFKGTQCYFAVTQETKLADATKQCESIFSGSRATTNVPAAIFNAMMLDKSQFHTGKDSSGASFKTSGAKQTICLYESGYKCDVGEQSHVFPGKCIDSSDEIMNLNKARATCDRKGMEMPIVGNELENRMIRGALGKNPAWILNTYAYFVRGEQKWHRQKYYSKYSTCHRPDYLYAGHEQNQACIYGMSSVVDHMGYWGNSLDKWTWSSVCVKDAENAFTPGKRTCVALHEWNEETGQCEWIGPDNSCAQAIDFKNGTLWVEMPNFPGETYKQMDFPNILNRRWNDCISRVIVRRGCMYSGFGGGGFESVVLGKNNLGYGDHWVPCYAFGDGLANWNDGLSLLKCFCDPTEADLNNHVPAPPPDKECIEHHVFDEVTQQCEWKHDPKFCGELITNDGRRQMIEIPNWPANRKYDFDHWTNATLKAENFHLAITEVIVRQHCWMTLKQWPGEGIQVGNPRVHKSLETAGYGKHQVKSYYNGLFKSQEDGTHNVVCECMNPKRRPYTGKRRKTRCAAHHTLNEETGVCEWTGPKDACMQMIDYTGVADFVRIPKFPQETAVEMGLVGTRWNDVVSKVVVRQGCMYSGFGGNYNTFDKIILGKNNLGYGEHWVPNFAYGDGLSEWGDGLSAIKCFCDPTEATLNDHEPAPPPRKKCVEHHVFNETTQSCEWKHDPKFCGELITNDGRRQMLEIPNYPRNKKYDFNHWETKKAENFHITVTEVIVRQHCWATMLNVPYAHAVGNLQLLKLAGYGRHEVASYYNGKRNSPEEGTKLVICECLH